MSFRVYTLSFECPLSVFYVGVTKQSLHKRLSLHLSNFKTFINGRMVKIEEVDVIESGVEYFRSVEKYWIYQFKQWGFALINQINAPGGRRVNKSKRDNTNVTVVRANHELVRTFLEEQGLGADIGKFYDKAAMEKLQKEKNKSR